MSKYNLLKASKIVKKSNKFKAKTVNYNYIHLKNRFYSLRLCKSMFTFLKKQLISTVKNEFLITFE